MCAPDEHAVFFLADARHHKDEDISKYRKVCLAFSDTGAQNYVSLLEMRRSWTIAA
jgi:general stress protein 26